MSSRGRWLSCVMLWTAVWPNCKAQEWTETELTERFLSLSPQALELRARVAIAQAEARGRSLYPNPSVNYSQEGAGFTQFIQAEQTVPLTGRIRYLREAGGAAVRVAEADRDALLWFLRSDFRIAFYRLLAAQERVALSTEGIEQVQQTIAILRKREEEGEGSRYDRLRAERELVELQTDLTAARSFLAATRARLAGFLPDGTTIERVNGQLPRLVALPSLEQLTARAIAARSDYRAELQSLARFQLEERAARRLRIPEPVFNAGLKRASVPSGLPLNPVSNITESGLAFGLTVPLPLFNRGQYEVSRFQAEQRRAQARIAGLARQIRTEVQGAHEVLSLRSSALEAYQREFATAGAELSRITRLAYQEGEVGILELLDALRVNRLSRLRLLDLQSSVQEAAIELDRVVGEEVRP